MMSDSDLCPYCKERDLSELNKMNKERHLKKCKKTHPYPHKKPMKQRKLGFLPSSSSSSSSSLSSSQVSHDCPQDTVIVTEPEPEIIEQHDPEVAVDDDQIVIDLDDAPEVSDLDDTPEASDLDDEHNSIPSLELNDTNEVLLVDDGSTLRLHHVTGLNL